VTILVRENNYWDNVLPVEESQMIGDHIQSRHIDVKYKTNLKEIVSDSNGRACAVITAETSEKIHCGYVGLTAGVSPNVSWLKGTDLAVDRGILVNEYLETNINDVYAVGDCVQLQNPSEGRRSIEAVWYTGRMMGETAAHNICNHSVKYDPGIWFNSAKFIDIEYQVYGNVPNLPQENHSHIFWQHKNREKSVRIIYDSTTKEIIGFNLLGVRFRHEVCEKWLAEKTNIETVLQNLQLAHFEPEFFKSYENEILAIYNQQSGAQLKLKNNKGLNKVLQFLKS
jgi:3-phenylpropionate/trans-cinnamate dioxygenase ferredoxin reductase component